MKYQVIEAAKMAQEGAELSDILTKIEDIKKIPNCLLVFLP